MREGRWQPQDSQAGLRRQGQGHGGDQMRLAHDFQCRQMVGQPHDRRDPVAGCPRDFLDIGPPFAPAGHDDMAQRDEVFHGQRLSCQRMVFAGDTGIGSGEQVDALKVRAAQIGYVDGKIEPAGREFR